MVMRVAENGMPNSKRVGRARIHTTGNHGSDMSLNEKALWPCSKLYCMRAPITSVVKTASTNNNVCNKYRRFARCTTHTVTAPCSNAERGNAGSGFGNGGTEERQSNI